MRNRIEYVNGRCNYANNHEEVTEKLQLLKTKTIADVRKVYKREVFDSVIDKYGKYI